MDNDNKNKENCQSTVHFVVYVIWCKTTNKFYVGVTRQKYAYTRIRQHKRGKQFVDVELQQVGWENCDWWVVEENIPAENIDECEKKWIDFFASVYPNGYNKTHGGIGNIIVSDDTREKIRQNALARDLLGERNPMYGKHHTEETKASISAKLSGENSPMYGKPPANKGVPHTEEARAKMSAAHKGEKNHFFGKHHTAESIEKNRQAHLGKPGTRKGMPCLEATKAKLREKALARDVRGERNPFYGKHHTPETIEKSRQANIGKPAWNKGKHPNAETRAKMSAAAKARWAKKKAAELAIVENADNQTTS